MMTSHPCTLRWPSWARFGVAILFLVAQPFVEPSRCHLMSQAADGAGPHPGLLQTWRKAPALNHYGDQAIQNFITNALPIQHRTLYQPAHNHHRHRRRHRDASVSKLLPSGPPPFRPTTLMLQLGSLGALDKLKRTRIFKRVYKSKSYYLFLDVLRQLTGLVDEISRKKIDIAEAKVAAVQAVVSRLATKTGQGLKLNWPLVMLNPHFLRETLSNPTFLVMLFHAIEVAYMSMPINFWLRPLVRLVKQPSPEREESIWRRRKRFYETVNGHGSSELQPNMKSVHFRDPGVPPPVALPRLAKLVRQITGRQAPVPTHYHYPSESESESESGPSNSIDQHVPTTDGQVAEQEPPYELVMKQLGEQQSFNGHQFMTSAQEEAFLTNQKQQQVDAAAGQASGSTSAGDIAYSDSSPGGEPTISPPDPLTSAMSTFEAEGQWLSDLVPSRAQLMSQSEFDSLDARERALVLSEARKRLEESRLTSELISKQKDYVESLRNRRDGLEVPHQVGLEGEPASNAPSGTGLLSRVRLRPGRR